MRRRANLKRSRWRIALVTGGGLVAIALAGAGIWAFAHKGPTTALPIPSQSASPSASPVSTSTPPATASTSITAASPTADSSQASFVSTLVPAPSQRAGASMAFDVRTRSLVLFGGLGGPQDMALGDTWIWNGSHWSQVSPAHSPPARYNAAMAYDAGRGQVVLVGGSNGDRSDTWTWDGADWTEMHPAAYPLPLRNGTMGMDYDAALDRVVIFEVGQPPDSYGYLTETWTWDGKNWKQLSPPTSPSFDSISQRTFAMSYYPPTKSLILLGARTWAFDGSTWAPVATPGGSPTGPRSNIAYDANTATLVLFGGLQSDPATSTLHFTDTWTWKGASWTRLSPPTSPPSISGDFYFGPSMTFDEAHGVVVVFGGTSDRGIRSNIVWTWDGSTWTRVG